MSLCVLDCSVAMSWCFEDETTSGSDALLEKISSQGADVPNLWHLEVANVLLQAQKRRRITPSTRAALMTLLSKLPIQTDSQTYRRAFRDSFAIAEKYQLTLYDASYLELAMRKGLPLATDDKALLKAAKKAGVRVI